MTRVANHGVRYGCAACDGRLLGLRPFEQLVPDGLGAALWIASAGGAPAGRCPFCDRALCAVPASAGGPDGLAVCRLCEQVWLPATAAPWLAAQAAQAAPAAADGAAAGAAALATMPTRCGECGAPWQPDEMGRCHYCHTQLTAPAPVVVFEPAPVAAGDLLGALARFVGGL